MNLVIGATGMVGTEVCRLLRAAGQPVRALVRRTSDPTKIEALAKLGVERVAGDLRDAASLEKACRGAKAVISTASSMPFAYEAGANTPKTTDEDGVSNAITAAREGGVQHFVYTSFPPMPASFPLQDAKRAVERYLRGSGLTYTILQPTYFTEVWLGPAVGFDHANRKAAIYGSGQNPISWISYRDVAQFAVASLGNQAARDATLELGGPEGISPNDVVKIFEEVGGKAFDLTHVPVEALQGQLAAASDPLQQSFAGLMLSYASVGAIGMAATLKAFPLKLATVREYARSVMVSSSS